MISTNKKEELELNIDERQIVQMKVGTQILEHLSKGIYSSYSGIIREFISNSFDADATKVVIRTKPEFDTFSVLDDGIGMDYKDFNEKFLFISRSDKRDTDDKTELFERPIIGRIGIGFVAASNICENMIIISSKKDEEFKFEAKVDFSKFRKIEYKKKEFYELAEVELINSSEEKNAHYTRIVLTNLLKEFKEYLLDKDIEEAGIKVPYFDGLGFVEIINEIERKAEQDKSFDLSKNIGRYWQMILEIANTSPIEYLNNGPIEPSIKTESNNGWGEEEINFLREIRESVKKLEFSIDFDGILLKKPIHFPNRKTISKKGPDFNIFILRDEIQFEDGSALKFKGYLYNQRESIYPPQFRGIVIRIKNTAIGGVDRNFLDYLHGEKQFLNWTFGEIYVEEGLEEAMNIDRNSFMMTHPHYQELRSSLHNKLHKVIFPECRLRYIRRKKVERDKEQSRREDAILTYLRSNFGEDFNVIKSKKVSHEPVDIDLKKGELIIYTANPIFKKIGRRNRDLLEDILILFHTSYLRSEGNVKKMREYFMEGLEKWTYD